MNVQEGKKLIDILLQQGKVSADFANSCKELSNFDTENKLKLEKKASDEDIAKAYGVLFNIPFIALKGQQIAKDVLKLVPEELAREYKIIAFGKSRPSGAEADVIHIATAEPSKLASNRQEVLNELQQKRSLKIDLGVMTLDDFLSALSQYKEEDVMPIDSNVKKVELDKITIAHDIITKFPEEIARKYEMVVFDSPHPSLIRVAVVEPEDKKVQEILGFIKSKNDIAIDTYKVTEGELNRALKFYEPPKPTPVQEEKPLPPPTPPPIEQVKQPTPSIEEIKPTIPEIEKKPELTKDQEKDVPEVKGPEAPKGQQVVLPVESDLDKFVGQNIKDVKDLEGIAETGNVPKTVAAAIILAVNKKASDIHIEPTEKNLRIRLRLDGILHDIIRLPIGMHPPVLSRIKILSKLKIDETRIPQDGRFDCTALQHKIDLRISTLPTIHGEKVAMRILDKSAHIYTLEELGLAGRGLKTLLTNMNKPYGIILSTGPTGSGKTTTLYAILTRISNASVNIVTLEDPVEYEMPGLNQCQIKPKIGFTFANGLRSILRQDPNIIMVGEIRDSETAGLATNAALTGHLVLSTLHTNDAAGAIPRLIDMGVEPFFLTSLINAIIAQRLVRKLCPKCKHPAHIPVLIMQEIERDLEGFNFPKPYQFFEGRGCSECELGYNGRLGIYEVLTMSPDMETLIISHKSVGEFKNQAKKDGMITMKQDGLMKALKGETTVSEVLRVISV